jgi:homoserine kinase
MNEIKLFCPATIANLSCGFDVLGLCLDSVGDEMIIRKVNQKGIKITKIEGANLPLDNNKNVAGVAALALLETIDVDFGFEIEIYKKIKAGSGIGSSAASAAGVVFGINELLDKPFSQLELVGFAMFGEELASGCKHADNVAPAIYGGITLVRETSPLDVIKLHSPNELCIVLLHPLIEVKTSEARAILSPTVTLKNAINQWGNVGALVAGLYKNDYELIGKSLQDVIVEPLRKKLIPGFDIVKKTALDNGALGAGISGSGPSIYALCKGIESAHKVANAIKSSYSKFEIPFDIYISEINKNGVRQIEP